MESIHYLANIQSASDFRHSRTLDVLLWYPTQQSKNYLRDIFEETHLRALLWSFLLQHPQ